MEKAYEIIGRFICGGEEWVIVLTNKQAANTMPKREYNKMIAYERKAMRKNG